MADALLFADLEGAERRLHLAGDRPCEPDITLKTTAILRDAPEHAGRASAVWTRSTQRRVDIRTDIGRSSEAGRPGGARDVHERSVCGSGRTWDRTRDLSRVKRALSR